MDELRRDGVPWQTIGSIVQSVSIADSGDLLILTDVIVHAKIESRLSPVQILRMSNT